MFVVPSGTSTLLFSCGVLYSQRFVRSDMYSEIINGPSPRANSSVLTGDVLLSHNRIAQADKSLLRATCLKSCAVVPTIT